MLVNIHPADYLDLLHLLTKLFFPRQSLAFSVLDILTAKALAACTMGATPGDKKHILRETETLYNAIQLVMNSGSGRVQVKISGSANMGLDMIS